MSSDPTPFTPPHEDDDELSWLRLIRSKRVGVATFYRLLGEHGSARAAVEALPALAAASGMRDYRPCAERAARDEITSGRRLGARLIRRGMPDYPQDLAALNDAPPLLWALGDPAHLRRPMVAIVGARNASSLGSRMARRLAEGLGQAGLTVVSGLARGIDAVAHLAALESGTVAVVAGGVDHIHPAENADLARRIARGGLILSEQPIGLAPMARHFPIRNRIISGLSRGVVVVEAAAQSGSLITGRLALDQGREVMAVPGHPFDGRAAGCNMLLRDGATLIRGPEDVLEQLGPLHLTPVSAPSPAPRAAPAARPQHEPAAPRATSGAPPQTRPAESLGQRILALLGPSPVAEDQLIRDLALPAASVACELVALEMAGRVHRQPGGLLCRQG